MNDKTDKPREIHCPEAEGTEVLEISDERALVLLDPLRWRVLESLGTGKTLPQLADALQVTDARLLYHLRVLAELGVVRLEQTGASPTGWRCTPVARRLRVLVNGTSDEAADLIPAAIAGDFNQAARELREGLYGQGRQFHINHNRSRLSDEQAAEFNRRLLALIEEFFPPGKGDPSGIKYGFHGVFTPIDLHPLADPSTDQ